MKILLVFFNQSKLTWKLELNAAYDRYKMLKQSQLDNKGMIWYAICNLLWIKKNWAVTLKIYLNNGESDMHFVIALDYLNSQIANLKNGGNDMHF